MVGQTGPPPKKGLVRYVTNFPTSGLQSQWPDISAAPYVQRLSSRLGEDGIANAVARVDAGDSSVQIARSIGVIKTGMLSLLRRRGVTIRQRRSLTPEQVVEAARLYKSGLYLRQVAEQFDVSTEQVRTALRRHGVVMRDDRGGRKRRSPNSDDR
jgi:hypothetical protein